MNTIEMEVALMKHFGIRQNIIVPNVSWGISGLHECDLLILTFSNYAWEVEIKVSKYDLLKDGEKKHNHQHNHIANLYFAVPYKLREIALEVIPDRSGLLTVRRRTKEFERQSDFIVNVERKPNRNKLAVKWTDKERMNLARLGAMRILGLKEKLLRQ